MGSNNEIVLYQPNEELSLPVMLQNETVWLSQSQIGQLFGVQKAAISKHMKNIFACKELMREQVVSKMETTAADGKCYWVDYYNLDMILSIGYRVNSTNATHFRQWANRVLRQYLLNGYAFNRRFERIEYRLAQVEEHQRDFELAIHKSLPPVEGIFYDGQIFDAYAFVSDLIKRANQRVVLIDNYVDESVLTLLEKRKANVKAEIHTASVGKQLKLDIEKHNAQFSPITVKVFAKSHDRFLIIDNDIYHLGASLKDLGRKWFAFAKLTEISADDLLNRIQ